LAKDRFDLSICGVIADAGLDSAKVLNFIICDLKAKPFTILLVALTAARTGNKDKIRFVKSFLPNI